MSSIFFVAVALPPDKLLDLVAVRDFIFKIMLTASVLGMYFLALSCLFAAHPCVFDAQSFNCLTQSIIYVPLQVNRFQKSILLIVQYKYLKTCSEDFIPQNLILRTRLCSTGVIPQPSWFFISTWSIWWVGNFLYHRFTSFEGASWGGQPLNIFTWASGAHQENFSSALFFFPAFTLDIYCSCRCRRCSHIVYTCSSKSLAGACRCCRRDNLHRCSSHWLCAWVWEWKWV